MRICQVSTYHSSNISYKNNSKPQNNISFGERGIADDWKSVKYCNNESYMYENPVQYLEEIKDGKHNLTDSFEIALTLRHLEKNKPDTTRKQNEYGGLIDKCERLGHEIYVTYDIEDPKRKRYLTEVYKNQDICENELKRLKKVGRNDEKIKAWQQIGKVISKSLGFNPNGTGLCNDRLIDTALLYKDKEMALLLMKHPRFEKPQRFRNEECKIFYEDLDKKLHKKSLFNIFYFKK